ncbi:MULTISPECIES: hypothetical protein [unclassified Streptomyces]|uniref:hypothetical protein n=1 Tax=unclassified Streptomyces TaxID=2593676 RepID=UPI001BE4FCA9|nr:MULTISPECIES: hypothetical protein [unclassified Streptomyces]MBT2406917.1 hypothetical protein [Streptomyces sp. ISL-21]MBT2613048.1 hypothetical protein [Streptomyces sp. ISL-87]
MPLDFTHPQEFSCFGTLHPDHLVAWSFGDPHVEWELTGLFSGPGAYTTVPLDTETDMHYRPGDQGAPNIVAQHLAARYGFDGLDVRGAVHFTGPSGETDRALGIAPDAFGVLYDRVKDICAALGVRTWCKVLPQETVNPRFDDLAPGDIYWFMGRYPHRFVRFDDFPADSVTLQNIPEARILVCEDEFEMTAYGTWDCRADRAPAGYWQRTGNQLLSA